jgi:hypothetical protein
VSRLPAVPRSIGGQVEEPAAVRREGNCPHVDHLGPDALLREKETFPGAIRLYGEYSAYSLLSHAMAKENQAIRRLLRLKRT